MPTEVRGALERLQFPAHNARKSSCVHSHRDSPTKLVTWFTTNTPGRTNLFTNG